jgi:hypothetical protein
MSFFAGIARNTGVLAVTVKKTAFPDFSAKIRSL